MKKLTLSLENLQVESFSTLVTPAATGTVRANSWVTDTQGSPSDLGDAGCSAFNTCLQGCGGSNPNSGWYSCGDGSDCANGETEWRTCTQDYKHCGY